MSDGPDDLVHERKAGHRALVVAGGPAIDPGAVPTLVSPGTLVVAVDSGYDNARTLGIPGDRIDVLVGDLDSISAPGLHAARRDDVHIAEYPADKDATDLELAFSLCLDRGVTDLVLVGAAGGRPDHELAGFFMACSSRWSTMRVTIVDERGRTLVVHDERELPVGPGSTVTLLAVGGPAHGVTTTGLAWELEGDRLDAGSTRGVSNVSTGAHPTVTVTSGCLVAVLPWATEADPTLPGK